MPVPCYIGAQLWSDGGRISLHFRSVWGAETRIRPVSRRSVPSGDALPALVDHPPADAAAVLPNADDGTKDLEILVLRHQLRGAAPQDRPPPVHLARPDRARRRKPPAFPRPLGIIPRHAPDAAALASHARAIQVDLPDGPQVGPTADRPGGCWPHRADGKGELPMGLRQKALLRSP
jgi:hypothetical protein